MKRSAFTLIELLVVISIIALLISILLPALGAARQTAIDATCLSGQRQLGIAALVYVNESGGMLPANVKDYASNPGAWNPTVQWVDKIGTHVWSEKNREPDATSYYEEDGNARIVKQRTPLHCPVTSDAFPRRSRFYASWDYNLNWYLGGRPGGGDTIKYPNETHLASDRFWFADTSLSGGPTTVAAGSSMRSNPRHSTWTRATSSNQVMPWMWMERFTADGHANDTANYLYGDGHAESLVFGDVDGMTDSEAARFTGSDLK